MVGNLPKNGSDQTWKQLGPSRLKARLKRIIHVNTTTLRLGLHAAADLGGAFDVRLRKVLPCEGLVGRIDPDCLPRESREFGCERAEQLVWILRPQIGKFRKRERTKSFCERDASVHANVPRIALRRGGCRLFDSLSRGGHLLCGRQPLGLDLARRFQPQFIRLAPRVPPEGGCVLFGPLL